MTASVISRLFRSLLESGCLNESDIQEIVQRHRREGRPLLSLLMESGKVSHQRLLMVLVKELKIPFVDLKQYSVDSGLKDIVPERVARQYNIFPVSHLGDVLTIAVSDPFDVLALDDIRTLTGAEVDVVLSTPADIQRAIESFYKAPRDSAAQEGFGDLSVSEVAPEEEAALDESESGPVIRLVNVMIQEAVRQRASDIHIEPLKDKVRVRYRIDGVLYEAMQFPKSHFNAVLVRLKILSRLNITTTRRPQDGRFKMKIGDQTLDFRVSTLPITHGEKIVLRVLDKSRLGVDLKELGFHPRSVALLEKAVEAPFGMVLVTGPTGSGKSTTLYSLISRLNTVERNIITIEDPVEYLIEGLSQIEVKPEIGLSFAAGLKAILRQSPDVVMVGEIRDFETADIAVKASLTGQLVFSTLHTNDAAGALTRLVDMGVEPFLVASSVVLVSAQRLCRRICPKCRVKDPIPDRVLKDLSLEIPEKIVFYKGKGCDHCRQTGYHGRLGVSEILEITDEIRDMLIREVSSDAIKDYARRHQGMITLREDVVGKWMAGETTLEEVLRVTADE